MRYFPSLSFPACLCILLAACSQDDSQQQASQQQVTPQKTSPSAQPAKTSPIEANAANGMASKPVESKNVEPNVTEPENLNGMPSHCSGNEKTYLSAKMKKVNETKEGIKYAETNNILSLCVDGDNIIYRYGKIGSPDLEKVATPEKPFFQHFSRIGRNLSVQKTYFNNGQYYYYVSESFGMGSGISIYVYHNAKRLVELFSGGEPGADFWLSTELRLPESSLQDKIPTHEAMQENGS